MKMTHTRRKGATSILALTLAALIPASLEGETATAQIIPQTDPIVEQVQEDTTPAPIVVPAIEQDIASEESVSKTIEESTIVGPVIIGEGIASYYGAELAGNRTANGERFNPSAMTAAHRTLPMGTMLRVTNISNGKSVVVRINDRGPFAKGRIIDVSRGAAEKISMIRSGTARVTLERVS